MLGVFYLWLHHLPEKMGHKKLQFEIVAVLGLLAMFTHMNIFWILGLLLALVDLPDIVTPLRRIALSTEKLAEIDPLQSDQRPTSEPRETTESRT